MARWRRKGAAVVAALALGLVAGCYERVSDGPTATYQFAWWVGAGVIAAGVLAMPAGWFLRKWSPMWGFVLLFMGPLLLLIAPSLYSDRVVIDDEHFEARYGFWFAPSVHDVRFDDLRAVQHATVTNDRGRKNRELHCLHKSGELTVIPCGDLVRNTVPEILDRAKARGVAVVE